MACGEVVAAKFPAGVDLTGSEVSRGDLVGVIVNDEVGIVT